MQRLDLQGAVMEDTTHPIRHKMTEKGIQNQVM